MLIEAQVLMAQINELIQKHTIPNLPDAPSDFVLALVEVQKMIDAIEGAEMEMLESWFEKMKVNWNKGE